MNLGIYVHIPFCLKKCGYCGFYSLPGAAEEVARDYVGRVAGEAAAVAPRFSGHTVDTVFFGGGTPTSLYPGGIDEISRVLRHNYGFKKEVEITCEANPETVTRERAEELRAAGANRASVGLQSASETLLRAAGRRHSYADFRRAVSNLTAAGFDNIGCDIMLGLPGQSVADVLETLKTVLSDAPGLKHVSVYALSLEAGTPMSAAAARGLKLPDGDACAEMYDAARAFLSENNFRRYEVSNFARPGYECRHNLKYWNMEEYLGLGSAAHSFYGGARYANSASLNYETVKTPQTDADNFNDAVMLGLRLEGGVSLKRLRSLYGRDVLSAPDAPALIKKSLLVSDGETLRVHPDKFYVMNAIVSALI